MPHIVIGDPTQREAKIGPGRELLEDYLGVLFSDSPDDLAPGRTTELDLVLMYWPGVQYSEVKPGSLFTVREGPKIVGFGEILEQP